MSGREPSKDLGMFYDSKPHSRVIPVEMAQNKD